MMNVFRRFIIYVLLLLCSCDSQMGILAIHNAARDGDLNEIIKNIESKPSLIDIQTKLGMTPIYLAAMKGHKHVAEYLIKNGANIEIGNHMGERPLSKATKFGHYDLVMLLIKYGAKVNVQDDFGQTPLHEAASYGYVDIVKILVSNGADVSLKNKYNKTPRDRALELSEIKPELSQYKEIAEYLKLKHLELNNRGQSKLAPVLLIPSKEK